MPMDAQPLIETLEIDNRINLYLLDAIPDENLADVLVSKGRDVGKQFAHIHNVRSMWLNVSLPEALAGLAKIEKDDPIDKELLHKSLTDSGAAIVRLVES